MSELTLPICQVLRLSERDQEKKMNLSHRSIIASMADGIGELSFAGEDWVARAKTEMDICHSLHRAA